MVIIRMGLIWRNIYFIGVSQLLLILYLSCHNQMIAESSPVEEIKIGVLIRHRGLEEPLNRTIEMLNADTSVLFNTRLTALVEIIESDNSYQASAAICRLISQNVWTIIGPQSIQLTPIIQSITSNYHIPLVLINWQPVSYHLANATAGPKKRQVYSNDMEQGGVPTLLNYTINLFPMADQLSRAYLDMIRYKEWKSFSLIYDNTENFLLVKDIFEASFSDTSINVQKVNLAQEYPDAAELTDFESRLIKHESSQSSNNGDNGAEGDTTNDSGNINKNKELVRRINYCNFDNDDINLSYKKLMKDLRKRGVENLVLSMSLDKVCKVLKEAANVGLLTFYNDYVIANLDTHLLNLTQLQPIMTNISGFSILDPDGQQTDFTMSKKWLGKRPTEVPKTLLSTEYSMMSDAISLVAYSLDELISEPSSDLGPAIAQPNSHCSASVEEPWPHGAQLMDVFKRSVRYGGYTGDLKFDQFGQRVDFNLEYVLHKNNTFKKIGTWSMADKLHDRSKSSFDFGLQAIKNKTLKVTVALTEPYVMKKKSDIELFGNDRYEGYCIDLMNKLAKKLQFNFIIKEVPGGQYGKIQNGSWTGMIRELLDWKADLAIVDLTITKERQSAVDFTHPFMTLGIAIMYKKPKLEEAELYSFLMPLSKEVWLSTWSAYVGISLTLWMISRLSPLEWKNPHPCFDNPDDRDLENEIHSIGASLWFTIGSLMQQGSDLAPRSPSVRALASVWYFFTLILISSYTANFAAFLTASRMQSPIESAEDLSKQTKIDYGCKEGGATQAFFASSNHSTYRRMWNFMESRKHQGVFPKDNSKGISMVKKGNFAFLMESTSLDYMVQRDCELTQIGGLLDHKGYGIALRKRSPFRAPLSKSIVELNEAGELHDLKTKWWSTDEIKCDEAKDSALATSELGIDKVGGVFVLLGLGVAIACCAAILEFIWKSLKTSKDQRDTIRAMLWQEVVRIMKFGPSKRPAAETLYHKSTSQPSETNLNEATSASHNLSKSNRDADGSSTYFSRFADGNGNMEAVGANHHQENNRPHQQAAFEQFRANTNNLNQGIYDKTPLGTIDASDSV
uniref:Glutamate receptor, ionotropic kainate 2 n=1 Tax=Aceria tosichella TaxID=561515 RepID=A0A6G1SD06_9ACAR